MKYYIKGHEVVIETEDDFDLVDSNSHLRLRLRWIPNWPRNRWIISSMKSLDGLGELSNEEVMGELDPHQAVEIASLKKQARDAWDSIQWTPLSELIKDGNFDY